MHIKQRADANKMVINWAKTKEVVFQRPSLNHFLSSMPLNDIEQVTSARLLGIIFQDKLGFDEHVTSMLKACSQCSYIMKLLRDHKTSLIMFAKVS